MFLFKLVLWKSFFRVVYLKSKVLLKYSAKVVFFFNLVKLYLLQTFKNNPLNYILKIIYFISYWKDFTIVLRAYFKIKQTNKI